jgi:hypothetical protein
VGKGHVVLRRLEVQARKDGADAVVDVVAAERLELRVQFAVRGQLLPVGVLAELPGQAVHLGLHRVDVREVLLHRLPKRPADKRGRILRQVPHAKVRSELDLADGRAVLAAQQAQQRRLALAVRPDQTDPLALGHLEPGALDDVIHAEALADARAHDQRHFNFRRLQTASSEQRPPAAA